MEVSLARTALRLGLEALKAKPGQIILIPDFCCDVVLHPLNELRLQTMTYDVDYNLSPNWDSLYKLDTSNVFGIIMIHYFGQPQDIKKFQKFCKANDIYLIEDNAHGYGGTSYDKYLGTFGDIGISSPRKILPIAQGGILHLLAEPTDVNLNSFLQKKPLQIQIVNFIKTIIQQISFIYRYIVALKYRKYDFSDPHAFKEKRQKHTAASLLEKYFIRSAKLKKISQHRRKLWIEWHKYVIDKGAKPVFANLSANSCPWAIPFYSASITERNSWIRWGLENNLPIFCWPSLPDMQIQKKEAAFEKWETVFCVELTCAPPK